MIVGAGLFQLPAIEKARAMGLRVVALDGDADAPGLKTADIGIPIDIRDAEACLARAKQYDVRGVMSVASEVALPTVAYIAEQMGLPGCGSVGVKACTNKAVMRDLFARHGTPSPRSIAVTQYSETEAAMVELGFPVVVKPADSSGSRGVKKVDTVTDLAHAFANAQEFSFTRVVLVEEFIDGNEVAVEGFVVDETFHLLLISDKARTPAPYLLDRTVFFPTAISAVQQRQIAAVAEAAIKALSIDNAPIHMELLMGSDGPVVVEAAARGAGFHVFTKILPWVTGVDAVTAQIQMVLGDAPDLTSTHARGAVLHFPEYPPGRVIGVEGLDAARAVTGIVDLDFYFRPGMILPPLRAGSDRAGHIIACCESRESAERSIEEAMSRLNVTIDTKTPGS